MTFSASDHPHRRYNPLNGQWVLVSPHRAKRPWQGQLEEGQSPQRPHYDPACYLCPGNERAGGIRNPEYENTFAFDNDFAALLPDAPAPESPSHPLLRRQGVRGECRVLCFSPRHDLSLAEMGSEEIVSVVDMWTEQTRALGEKYRWVQIFENKGAVMGCSNPHPHGQVWAQDGMPEEALREDAMQIDYLHEHGIPLLQDYVELELREGARLVVEEDHWIATVPPWALWPFETLVVCRDPVQRMDQLNAAQRQSLASLLKRLLVRYDNLFSTSFPYSMGWHGAPHGEEAGEHWRLHAHFYPPLLRSASVKKFMVGYEMLGEAQRDITPEQAAVRLAEQAEVHYAQTRPDK